MDGPFAESKETVAGYILLQVDSLDEAVEIAKECPGLDYGISVEVRLVDHLKASFSQSIWFANERCYCFEPLMFSGH